MRCQLRSADRTLYDGDASMVVAQSPRGEFAILSGHAPLLGALAQGPIRIEQDGVKHVFVSRGGTVRVANDVATLLVESAVALDEIDIASVKEQLAGTVVGEREEAPLDPKEREYLLSLEATVTRYG